MKDKSEQPTTGGGMEGRVGREGGRERGRDGWRERVGGRDGSKLEIGEGMIGGRKWMQVKDSVTTVRDDVVHQLAC